MSAARTRFLLYRMVLLTWLWGIFGMQPIHAQDLTEQQPTTEEIIQEFPEDSLGRRTPRGTVNGYIRAMAEGNPTRAAHYLNLPDNIKSSSEGERIVNVLQRLLDIGGNILPYTWISDESTGNQEDDLPNDLDRVGSVHVDGESVDLYVEKTLEPDQAPIWLFSSATLEEVAAAESEETLLVDRLVPDFLKTRTWGGVYMGQWFFIVVLVIISYLLAWCIISLLLLLIPKIWTKARSEPAAGIIKAFALPIRIYLTVWLFVFMSQEVGISIIVRQRLSWITIMVGLGAVLILLWRLADFIGGFSKKRMVMRGNASGVSIVQFLSRGAKIAIVIFGVIAVLGAIGVDVTTGLAALGIGGIALALGAQKTIENFVGSVTLITDQPVRVGDFCKVGETVGTVEAIGMRSTRIRTNERTIVTIPNGEFSSAKIENYAHRDRFLFSTVLGVRYETSTDQIRFLLVEIRSMLYSHPKVNPDPARIRFQGLGSTSLNLEIFAYINATSFDDYLEVKEDLFLRIMEIVEESGTDFAFPSQTLYFAKDKGLSQDKIQQAEQRVQQWKENNKMPLPGFDPDEIQHLKDTIAYPPEGSVKRKNPQS